MSEAGRLLKILEETCPECGGSGGGYGGSSEPSCPHCHGTGEVGGKAEREWEPEDDFED